VAHAIKAKKARLSGRDFVQATGFTHDEDAKAPPPFTTLLGADGFKSVIEVDQSPIGKTPRSTPATYLGIFDQIRQFFATLPEAKIRGFTASRFSFNTQGGRCEACQGAGRIKLEMAFMPNTYLPCDDCRGSATVRNSPTSPGRANPSARCCDSPSTRPRSSSISTPSSPPCAGSWSIAAWVTSRSGRASPTLSGGEAQRLKLVTELSHGLQTYTERSRGIAIRNLYLLEEPTIGLHLSDCEKLIKVLHNARGPRPHRGGHRAPPRPAGRGGLHHRARPRRRTGRR
jgi:excinuclease ABC subunit A